MKELSMEQMEMVSGGADCETVAGVAIGLTGGLALGALSVSTGGLALGVATGLSGYFGTMGVLLCGMMK